MKSFVCFAMLAVLAGVQFARVPAQDQHSVGRVRRSNPMDMFNKNPNNKKVVKKKPKPKPTTQAPTTSTPTVTTTTPTTTPSVNMTVKNKMPEYIAEKMGKLKTKAQVMRFLGITASMSQKINAFKKTLPPLGGVSGQSSGSSDANSAWITSTDCMPRPQVVRYPQPNLYHGVIWPPCTMASRCGGCCFVDQHRCVPDKVKDEFHTVYYVPYSRISSQRNSRKKRNVGFHLRQIPVQNHLSCKCQCKVRPQDCDPKRQYHHESTCQCKCKDAFTKSRLNCAEPFRYDKETCSCKCQYPHRHCPVVKQHWDSKQCKCTCDDRIRCPMGFAMNKNSCECEDIKMSDFKKSN